MVKEGDRNVVEVLCVLLGAILAIVTDALFNVIEKRNKRIHSTRLLYYDMLSIIKYVAVYKEYKKDSRPNIRYNSQWQNMLLEMGF